MIRICFHIHSNYSGDSLLRLDKIVDMAVKNNIQAIILADHDNLVPKEEIEKTPLLRQLRQWTDPPVGGLADTGGRVKKIRIILGEEIKTTEGEIIGIFLKEKINPGFSPEETIKKIKEQGGIVIVPHPFDRFRLNVIKKEVLLTNINQIDAIEIFNAGNLLNLDNKKAEKFAKEYNKIAIVGSDAHLAPEIIRAIIEIDDFDGSRDFLEKLKKAKFYTSKSGIFPHFIPVINRIFKKLKLLR